jgi:hypothetical protein
MSSIPSRLTVLSFRRHTWRVPGCFCPPVHFSRGFLSARKGKMKLPPGVEVKNLRAFPPLTQAYTFHYVMLQPIYPLMLLLFHLLSVLFRVLSFLSILIIFIVFHCLLYFPSVSVMRNFFDCLVCLFVFHTFSNIFKCLLLFLYRSSFVFLLAPS